MAEKIRVILPQKYDLVVGDTFQLFYRGVIECPNPYVYSIVSICEKGRNFPRYFEYAPTEPGQHKLTIKVYDAQRNLLGEAETMLNVVAPKEPKKTTKILCIGDSLTGGGWPYEAYRRVTQEGGEPAGLGFENAVKFIGSRTRPDKYPGIAMEGRSGFGWDCFLGNLPDTLIVECPNRRPAEDINSLWQDINGNLWKLTYLKIDYPKFVRYNNPDAPYPEHGPLTHYAGAKDTSPIEFNNILIDKEGTPFMNPETGEIDFLDYCRRNNVETPDVAYIFLGSNGLMSVEANTHTREEYCQRLVNKGKWMIGRMKEAFPNLQVKLMGLPMWSVNGGIGHSFGAILPLTDLYELIHYKMELNKAYQAWCLEDGYRDFMEFVDISGQFDCENNFPCKEKPVNTRSTVMERIDTDACHPSLEGYKQIGDAVYRNIVASFCSE